ncbi:ribonuclease H-like domain-containing protein [Tanacetum coccineum]
MYETFNASSLESLDCIFNRLQKILSQLTILGEIITPEDLNLKFLRSSQNVAFLPSIAVKNDVNTANVHVSTGSTPVSTASTNNSTACLSDATLYDLSGHSTKLDKNKKKVECFNCHKLGYFARECRKPKSQENKNISQDSLRRTVNVEESSSKVMLAIDGTGFDWSYMADEEASTNFAFMAFSDSEVQNNKTCSITCLKNFEDLKSKYDKLRIELNKSESDLDSYKKGLALVEEQLVFYKKNESMLCDQIAVPKRDASFNESDINGLKKQAYFAPLYGFIKPQDYENLNSPEFEVMGVKVIKRSISWILREVFDEKNVSYMVINATMFCNEAMAIPGQNNNCKESSNPLWLVVFTKTISPMIHLSQKVSSTLESGENSLKL